MSKVVELNEKNFNQEVLESGMPVLVDFWAPWCGPCRMMAPVLDELSVELDGKLKIAKLDVENPAHQQLAMTYGIQSIPNLKLFKSGKVENEFVGFKPKEALAAEISEALK